MSSKPTRKEILLHIERVCIKEAQQLLKLGYTEQALTSLVLGMEWFGTALDGKPSGAKKLSRKRFELALKQLPEKYYSVHRQVDLYKRLRNRSIHNPWIVNANIRWTNEREKHLDQFDEDGIQLSIDEFCVDFGYAVKRMQA